MTTMSATPNSIPLTPLAFLRRAASVFGDRAAIVDGDRSYSYAEFAEEAQLVARALRARTGRGDRVAVLSPNVAEMLIAHFSVPLAGDVLVAVNTRLAVDEIAQILDHSGARVLLVECSLLDAGLAAAVALATPPEIVVIGGGAPAGTTSYDSLIAEGAALEPLPWSVEDENDVIAINYTSGTTGDPKGVMYSHRGAYLNSMGFLHHGGFDGSTRYLWTLPMFHCNGWCAAWSVTAAAALHICIRAVREDVVWDAIDRLGATHLCGAPTVLGVVADAPQAHPLGRSLHMVAGGAPPSPAMLEKLESVGVTLTHAYGLTEVYGPYTVCEYQPAWDELRPEERATRMARQGVGMIQSGEVRIVDENLVDVPADGCTIGEIVMRGNNVMRGYFQDPEATASAFAGGWFHSGDLGVMHADGYIEVKDRSKDIIISGGENISSIEVENALLAHPNVADAAVVGVPHERWGERPVAFVVVRGQEGAPEALRAYLRERMAAYKVPDRIEILDSLPRTSTGKVLKRSLREQASGAG